MKLFLLTAGHEIYSGSIDSMVICARNENSARNKWLEKSSKDSVRIIYLGIADNDVPAGIISVSIMP